MNVWRDVTFAEMRAVAPGPGSGHRTRWWVLTLSCGHKVERSVCYRKLDPPQAPGTRRSAEDALPAVQRVSCRECARAVLAEMFSLDSSQDTRYSGAVSTSEQRAGTR